MIRSLIRPVAIALAVAVVVTAVLGLAGARPRPAWFAATALAAALATVALRALASRVVATEWPDPHDGHHVAWWNSDGRTQFLATWIQEAGRDPVSFARVRAVLAEVADAKVRPDPVTAETVGPEVWAVLTAEAASAREIEKAVVALENLNRDR